MKLSFLTTLLILFSISFLNAQIKKEVDDGIFVTFPASPDYKTTTSASTYVSKTENCLFMVIIQRNAIPNYPEYVMAKQKWTNDEVEKAENSFLDNAAKAKLDYSESTGTIEAIKIGKYNGRKIDYSAINPATGERGKRYTRLFLIRDKALSFEVWLLNNNQAATQEKEKFLNSITVNTSTQNTSIIPPKLSKGISKSTGKSSSKSKGVKDYNTASKYETEQWILSKLRSYAPESYDVPIDKKNTWSGIAWIVKDIDFSFDTFNLVINYSHAQPNRFGFNNKEESKVFYKVSIPIYAIERVFSVNNDLGFNTDGSVIVEENMTEIKKTVTSYTFVPFNASSETDLVKRLEKAFLHLKKFYTKSDNNELF